MYTQLSRTKKGLCLLMTIILIVTLTLPPYATSTEAADSEAGSIIRILEIQPTTAFDITDTMKSSLGTFLGKEIEITKMPMPLFISKAEEVNGLYDIVYIGNNTSTTDTYNKYYNGNVYSRFGPQVNNNCNVSTSVSGNKEFYSGNDISDIASKKIESVIKSGQLVIFDNGIFDYSKRDTKLYKNFIIYKDNSVYANFKAGTTSNLLNNLKLYKTESVRKRPLLSITQKPAEYNGSNIAENNGLISFAMNLHNNNGSQPMKVCLFIDKNGDGVFKSDEIAQTNDDVGNAENYSINYLLPNRYTGLVPWKIEVTDNYGAKSYETGFSAFKGEELQIRVLQLLPNNSDNYATLKLSSLSNYNGQNLLYKQGEYNIVITEMKISDFNTNYGNSVNGKPTTLNGNYDMVIFGFDDAYVGDLSGRALNDIKAFADSGQAIMFTHDTIGFRSSNLTTAFKDRLGMNAFATDSAKPSGITVSTGMTRLALLNANGDSRFPDTVLTSKINESNLTKYPFILGEIQVSPTHLQYIRLNPEDSDIVTAFTYRNEYRYNHGSRTATLITSPAKIAEDKYHEYDGMNDYYTYFKGNLTFSGTGHSPIKSLDELKMFVNTMLKASVGANHAPSVEIIGLNDGQDIANTLKTLNFSVKANDPDIDDDYLNCVIYIDNDNDGVYESGESKVVFDGANALKNSVDRAVEMAKNVSDSVTKFRIKAVVTDPSGAQGTKEITINNKNIPVLNLSHNTINCLVGDTVQTNLTVSAQATTLNTLYKELMLNMKLDTTKFSAITAVGSGNVSSDGTYSKALSNVNFTPNPDISIQNGQVRYTCGSEGAIPVTAKLTYKDSANATKVSQDAFYINVKTGKISVTLKENKGNGLSGQQVTLKRYSRSTTGEYILDSSFMPLSANTDSAGAATFAGVPTGYYGATITLPNGLEPVDHSNSDSQLTKMADAELNYDNNMTVITFPDLYRVPAPVLTLSHNSINCLVGDTVQTELTVNAQPTTLRTIYKNLVLRMNMDITKFSGITAVGTGNVSSDGTYSKALSNVNFTPNPDISTQNGQVRYTCGAEGVIPLTSELSYVDNTNTTKVFNDSFNINVRTGQIKVYLKDNNNIGLSDKQVILKRYIRTGPGAYTEDNSFTPLNAGTVSDGSATFTGVPTGYYGATVSVPQGYAPLNNSYSGSSQLTKMAGAELNYDNSNLDITLPALYKVPVLTINGEEEMGIWTKQKLTTEVTIGTDHYKDWIMNWTVESVGDQGGLAEIDSTGTLFAKKTGTVKVTATAVNRDAAGNLIQNTFMIKINNQIDIN